MRRAVIEGAAECPGCGCEDTSVTFQSDSPPALLCHGCLRWWTVRLAICKEIRREEGPRHPPDAQ
jgi:hypothetical protein